MELVNGTNEIHKDAWAVFEITDGYEGVEGYTKPGWYFWDETETTLIGPFRNSNRAQIAQNVYAAKI